MLISQDHGRCSYHRPYAITDLGQVEHNLIVYPMIKQNVCESVHACVRDCVRACVRTFQLHEYTAVQCSKAVL